jgi:hypothetical protein
MSKSEIRLKPVTMHFAKKSFNSQFNKKKLTPSVDTDDEIFNGLKSERDFDKRLAEFSSYIE